MRTGGRRLMPATLLAALGLFLASGWTLSHAGLWPAPPTARSEANGSVPDSIAPEVPRDAAPASIAADAAQPSVRLEEIGHNDLGGRGLNADVWLHRGIAYVGTWAAGSDRARGCPGSGVKIVDLADPTQPTPIGAAAQHPGTS